MRIWHQSFTTIDHLPAYAERMDRHVRAVVRSDTEVVLHGMVPGTYAKAYPGDDLAHSLLFGLHARQWLTHALAAEDGGFDAFACCSLPDPFLREIRSALTIPVVGAGEICFHLANMLGSRFGLMLFNGRMSERYLNQIRMHGLSEHCVGVQQVSFTFDEVIAAFDDPAPIIDRFRADARKMIAAGADVIIPGEIPLNVLLASEGVREVDGAALIDSLGVTIKMAETFADLRASTGLQPARRGWFGAAPSRARLNELIDFYRG